MYYILACFGPDDQDRAAIGNVVNTKVNWQLGRRFEQSPPTPVLVDLNPEFPGMLMPMFDKGILLFTEQMLRSVRAAGVDNLDVYDAVLRDPNSGTTYDTHKAINIIGTIAAADLDQSVWEAPSGTPLVDTDFDSLSIDERRTRGARMFRLAECVTAIVIHERVKNQLVHDGIPYLDFVEPRDFVG